MANNMTRNLIVLIWLAMGVAIPTATAHAQDATDTAKTDAPAAVDPEKTPSPTDPKPLEYPTWQTLEPGDYLGYNQRASLIQRGKMVYDKYCVGCHGVNGDGNGVAAKRLITKPRNFTSGIYKFRSTDSSSLPLEADLYRTITHGLSRVSMPAFPLMPERDKLAVIEYVKGFYADWDKEKDQRKRVFVPSAPPPAQLHAPDRLLRGRVVYIAMQCGLCHGSDGQGKNATRTEYTDAWGNPQKPFNFTRGNLKGGNDPEDIYRTFHTGLRSIMPAYAGVTLATVNKETFLSQQAYLNEGELEQLEPALKEFPETPAEVFSKLSDKEREELVVRNSWDLVAYIMSLRQNTSTAAAVLGTPTSIKPEQ